MMSSVVQVFFLLLHPFYVSITEVDFNEQGASVEVSSRIFYDDLEVAVKAESGERVDLINPADRNRTDSLLRGYFARHLQIAIDGEFVPIRYLGYEIDEDVAWCFLEAAGVTALKKMTVTNTLLYGQFDKQTHIMHITAYGKRKSTKLDYPEREASFEWK